METDMKLMTNLDGYKAGDKVIVNTHSNIGMVEDTIRALFVQNDTLGNWSSAAILTNHSWAALSDCTLVRS
jgi:hypothetical protein